MGRLSLRAIDTAGADATNDTPRYNPTTDRLEFAPGGTSSGGSSGGSAAPTTADTPPASPGGYDDEFNDASGMSGPANGLAAKWSKVSAAETVILDSTKAPDRLYLKVTGQGQGLKQAAPSGDFTITCSMSFIQESQRTIAGLFIANASGNGIGLNVDNGDTAALRNMTGWVVGGTPTYLKMGPSPIDSSKWFLYLRKASGTYYGAAWADPGLLPAGVIETSFIPTAFTPAFIGVSRAYGTDANAFLIDWFRVS